MKRLMMAYLLVAGLGMTGAAVFAADPEMARPAPVKPVSVKIDAKQMQALGIQLAALQRQTDAVLASFPAQVVVPPDREQIISSPVAGLVLQVLVQPNQAVRAGAPLVRLAGLGALVQLLQTATPRWRSKPRVNKRSTRHVHNGSTEAQAALREVPLPESSRAALWRHTRGGDQSRGGFRQWKTPGAACGAGRGGEHCGQARPARGSGQPFCIGADRQAGWRFKSPPPTRRTFNREPNSNCRGATSRRVLSALAPRSPPAAKRWRYVR